MTARSKSLLIVGATSDMGRAIAARYAKAGWRLILAARTLADAEREARDLSTRFGATVRPVAVDVLDLKQIHGFPAAVGETPDALVCVVGMLGNQDRARTDPGHAAQILRANFEGPALVLGLIAQAMAARGSGLVIGVTSVAGERGRASNYVYGSAKAGLSAFLSGLRQSLAVRGVRVVTVKPGFVRTRMTVAMPLPRLLTATPREVAEAVFAAGERGGPDVLYVRWMWRWIMLVVKLTPESLFKRIDPS